MWIEFGVGKSLSFIPIHDIASELGEESYKALLFYMHLVVTTLPLLLLVKERRNFILFGECNKS